jgi:hypothetical protein
MLRHAVLERLNKAQSESCIEFYVLLELVFANSVVRHEVCIAATSAFEITSDSKDVSDSTLG